MSKIRFVGLDVHADTIAVAVAEPGEEVRSWGIIPTVLSVSDDWSTASGLRNTCEPAMKQVRPATCCTGSWSPSA
jgi:hypothetical protein